MIDFPTLLSAFGLTAAQISLVVFASLLVMGLTSAVDRIFQLETNLKPLVSLLVGVLVMIGIAFVSQPNIPLLTAIFIGLVLGLLASGMWSQGKALFTPTRS